MYSILLVTLLLSAPDSGKPLPADVPQLIKNLDSNRFEVRQQAADRLEEMVAQPELSTPLASEFRRVLLQPNVSFEVRWHVKNWARRLPSAVNLPPPDASPQELDQLVRQLDSDVYAERSTAACRLEWLLTNPKLSGQLLTRIRQRLSDEAANSDLQHPLVAAWQRARAAWFVSGASADGLPAVSDAQIAAWLDDLVKNSSGNGRHPGEAAERELLDLLARDEYVPKLKKAIADRLQQTTDNDQAAKLNAILEWTKPELVAEAWEERHPRGEQHVPVGVPTVLPGAVNPTHFDRVDDKTAHCVRSNSLTPGDYPIGVAFPLPGHEHIAVHLVNLPTPKRRMAYTYFVRSNESKRLVALTQRTLERWLAEHRLLTESELLMLTTLEPAEVSRFAGKYLNEAKDAALAQSGPPRFGGRPSRFGLICGLLAAQGTKDAMPGLAEAIAKDVFLPPTPRAQYRMHWIAALAIALRDPWPDVDAWLVKNLENTESLVEGQPGSAKVGPTAAAILLVHHQQQPGKFNLVAAPDTSLNAIKLPGFLYNKPDDAKQVHKWWNEQKSQEKKP